MAPHRDVTCFHTRLQEIIDLHDIRSNAGCHHSTARIDLILLLFRYVRKIHDVMIHGWTQHGLKVIDKLDAFLSEKSYIRQLVPCYIACME